MKNSRVLSVLNKYGQEHIASFYLNMNEEERAEFEKQAALLDFDVLKSLDKKSAAAARGTITPIEVMRIDEISAGRDKLEKTGLSVLARGEVGAVLLAGGMGTRLGFDGPKGMYNIGITRELYIFECIFNNLIAVVNRVGRWIPLFIMTSEQNDFQTREFLKEKGFFSYNPDYVFFYTQEQTPVTDLDGKILMETETRLASSPNGNGGWYSSMLRHGIDKVAEELGICYFNVFAVDNVLQKIADPAFIGAVVESGCASGAKVVRKSAPDERVGVMCLEDGKPSVVEYYEMTDEIMNKTDQNGERVYNFGVILNYLFRRTDIDRVVREKLPIHVVKRKIPCLGYDDKGAAVTVKPDAENGYKFETLVLDMVNLVGNCIPFEVERSKEFAPVKNRSGIDSVDSARALLVQNGIIL